jgi:tRNA(adenine34) deaminase
MDDEFFMLKALEEAEQALRAGEFPVGCVLVYDNRVLVTGARYHTTPEQHNEIDHAEMLALRRLIDLDSEIDREGVILFSTLEPCLMCYAAMVLNGIRQIVYAYEDVMGGGTSLDVKQLNPFYRDTEMKIKAHVLREKSLVLFKRFFTDPKNTYLKGSLLAEYTMSQ